MYLPMDYKNVCNMGYFFLDVVDAQYGSSRSLIEATWRIPRNARMRAHTSRFVHAFVARL